MPEVEPMSEGSFICDTPMSIEKALTPIVKKSCPSDHVLYDVSLYSSEIFAYMREFEVCFKSYVSILMLERMFDICRNLCRQEK